MEREKIVNQLKKNLKTKNLLKHSYAVEAIMKGLAQYLNEDAEEWGIAGLVHDIDYDETFNEPEKHSIEGAKLLRALGFEESIVHAVEAHNEIHGIPRENMLDKALFCADSVSGLITACALILPSKKLSEVDVDFILRRFDEKAFARGANRENIKTCSELGLSLEEFIEISLRAMQGISGELGL